MVIQVTRYAVDYQRGLEDPLAAEHPEIVRAEQRGFRVEEGSVQQRYQGHSGVRHGHHSRATPRQEAVCGSAVVTLNPAMNSGIGR